MSRKEKYKYNHQPQLKQTVQNRHKQNRTKHKNQTQMLCGALICYTVVPPCCPVRFNNVSLFHSSLITLHDTTLFTPCSFEYCMITLIPHHALFCVIVSVA